jgi:hypothetical protein
MSMPARDEQPTQAISPGAEPTQEPSDRDQGNAALVDPASAAQTDIEPDSDAQRKPGG